MKELTDSVWIDSLVNDFLCNRGVSLFVAGEIDLCDLIFLGVTIPPFGFNGSNPLLLPFVGVPGLDETGEPLEAGDREPWLRDIGDRCPFESDTLGK